MRTKSIIPTLILTAVIAITLGGNDARAGFPPPPIPPGLPGSNVNVRVQGYLPAPPGVNVMIDSGRPYYIERDRRVYIEREDHHRYKKNKHYKKRKKHYEDNYDHEDNGNHYGERKHGKHGR